MIKPVEASSQLGPSSFQDLRPVELGERVTIRQVTRRDIEAIVDLQEKNTLTALGEDEAYKNGFVSWLADPEFLEKSLGFRDASGPRSFVIEDEDGGVRGHLLNLSLSKSVPGFFPEESAELVMATLKAKSKYANLRAAQVSDGQILLDSSLRGKRLATPDVNNDGAAYRVTGVISSDKDGFSPRLGKALYTSYASVNQRAKTKHLVRVALVNPLNLRAVRFHEDKMKFESLSTEEVPNFGAMRIFTRDSSSIGAD